MSTTTKLRSGAAKTLTLVLLVTASVSCAGSQSDEVLDQGSEHEMSEDESSSTTTSTSTTTDPADEVSEGASSSAEVSSDAVNEEVPAEVAHPTGPSVAAEAFGTNLIDALGYADNVPFTLVYTNIERAEEATGISRPTSPEGYRDHLDALRFAGAGSWNPTLSNTDVASDWPITYGFELLDLDEGISATFGFWRAGVFSTGSPLVLDEVEPKVREDPLWTGDVVRVDQEFGSYLDWDIEDASSFNVDKISSLRPLGEPGQLAVIGGNVVWSKELFFVTEALKAEVGESVSIGGSSLLSSLADAYEGPPIQWMYLDYDGETAGVAIRSVTDSGAFQYSLLVLDPSLGEEVEVSAELPEPVEVVRIGEVWRIVFEGYTGDSPYPACVHERTCLKPA